MVRHKCYSDTEYNIIIRDVFEYKKITGLVILCNLCNAALPKLVLQKDKKGKFIYFDHLNDYTTYVQ